MNNDIPEKAMQRMTIIANNTYNAMFIGGMERLNIACYNNFLLGHTYQDRVVRFEALKNAAKKGATPYDFQEAMGSAEKLTALVKKYGSNIVFPISDEQYVGKNINCLYHNVEGAPFQIGQKVRITNACDEECNIKFIGKEGVVVALDYESGCGQQFPYSPLIKVEIGKNIGDSFWPEELEKINEDE